MVGTAARLLALTLVLAPAALLPRSVSAAEAPATSSTRAEAVTVRTLVGQVERLAEVHAGGTERTRWELDTGDRVWFLRPGRTTLVPGARMEVTGTVSGDEVVLSSARVLSRRSEPTLRARASSTRVLVMRVFWAASAPAHPTATETKSRLITRASTWFRNVSGGRYSVAGSVTPWLKITRPSSCAYDTNRVMDQALSRARAKGFSPANYGRHIVYLPCKDGFVTGLGSMPGKRVWLFGTTDLGTNVHEQGHNLGLGHANLRVCRANGARTTWSSSCSVHEYADWSDAMGNGPPTHYSVINKRRLGWLSSSATVSADATRTLTPADETSSGLKALGVRTSTRTYWVELRSGANEDSGIPVRCRGVQVRFSAGSDTQVLDLLPGNSTAWDDTQFLYDDDSCTALPTGSSWVTPEGVRIIAASGGLSGTQVQIDYGFGAAKVPAAPDSVSVDASTPDEVTLEWSKPSDRGALVTRYEVKRPDGTILTVPSLGGDDRTATLTVPAGSYPDGLQVRAVNRVGLGAWASSPSFSVTTLKPSASITSPAAGATVDGEVPVSWSAAANPTSQLGVSTIHLEVDGEIDHSVATSGSSPAGTMTWYSTYLPNGQHTLRVGAEDGEGRVGWSEKRLVTVANPVVALDSPAPGATVSGTITVSFHAEGAGSWSFASGEVLLDGSSTPATKTATGWSAQVDTRTSPNGAHDLVARLEDPARGTVEKAIEVTSSNTMPVITVTSPTGTVTDPRQTVAFSVSRSWPWDGFHAELDGQWVGSADVGEPLVVDLSGFASGSHTLKVVGEYGGYHEVASAGKALTLSWPTRSLAWGNDAPTSPATVSGVQPVAYALTPPAAWTWEFVCVEVYDGADWWDQDCAQPGEPLSWDTTWSSDGTYQVRLHAWDSQNAHYRTTTVRTWTVDN